MMITPISFIKLLLENPPNQFLFIQDVWETPFILRKMSLLILFFIINLLGILTPVTFLVSSHLTLASITKLPLLFETPFANPFLNLRLSGLIHGLGRRKSSNLNGFTREFFFHQWDTIGFNFLHVHRGSTVVLLSLLFILKNHLIFISKTPSPSNINNFQIISLYNVSYWAIVKTTANHIKLLLPSIISP